MSNAEHLLAWMGQHVGLEISWGPPRRDVEEEYAWMVHQRTGSVNDREWHLVGQGATPLEALRSAHDGGLVR